MRRCLEIGCLMTALAISSAAAVADDSFLNWRLPTTWVYFSSGQDLLQVLRSVVPRPLILPEGMSLPAGMPAMKPLVNPTEAEKRGNGSNKKYIGSAALFGPAPGEKRRFTVRDYLDQAVKFLGMTWSYDPARDSVVLDFPWHVSSSQSSAELMKTLSTTRPPEDDKHVYSSTIDLKNDAWRPAFNALLSKPGNFPKAWPVRWNTDGMFPGLRQPIDTFTGTILDEIGKAHFLILDRQWPDLIISLSAGSTINFYLFSASGMLEDDGSFCAEDGSFRKLSVKVDLGGKRLIIHNGLDPAYNRYDQIFAVEKNRFVFKDRKTYGRPDFPPLKMPVLAPIKPLEL